MGTDFSGCQTRSNTTVPTCLAEPADGCVEDGGPADKSPPAALGKRVRSDATWLVWRTFGERLHRAAEGTRPCQALHARGSRCTKAPDNMRDYTSRGHHVSYVLASGTKPGCNWRDPGLKHPRLAYFMPSLYCRCWADASISWLLQSVTEEKPICNWGTVFGFFTERQSTMLVWVSALAVLSMMMLLLISFLLFKRQGESDDDAKIGSGGSFINLDDFIM